MPSSYVHEPDAHVLDMIAGCVAAMQHSEVESMRDRVDAHESQRRKPPSAMTGRNGCCSVARLASTKEMSFLTQPLSQCPLNQGRKLCTPSAKLAEKVAVAEGYVGRRISSRVAPATRQEEAHFLSTPPHCVVYRSGGSRGKNKSVQNYPSSTSARQSLCDSDNTSCILSHVLASGGAARPVLPSSATLSRTRSHPPPSCPGSDPGTATSEANTNDLEVDCSAENHRGGACARSSPHSTFFSLSAPQINGTCRVSQDDCPLSMDEVPDAVFSWGNQKQNSCRALSSQVPWQQAIHQEERASTPSTWWAMSKARAVSLALSVQESACDGTVSWSTRSSCSPPSITAAMRCHPKDVKRSALETLWPSLVSRRVGLTEQSSHDLVMSHLSHTTTSTERGGRSSTDRRATMRRSVSKQKEVMAVPIGSVVETSLKVAATAAPVVVPRAGGFPIRTKDHLSGAGQSSSPLPRNPQQGDIQRQSVVPSVETLASASSSLQRSDDTAHKKESFTADSARGTPPSLIRAPPHVAQPRLVSSTSSPLYPSHAAGRGADDVGHNAYRALLDGVRLATCPIAGGPPSADHAPFQMTASFKVEDGRYFPIEGAAHLLGSPGLTPKVNEPLPVSQTFQSLHLTPPPPASAVVADGASVTGVSFSPRSAEASNYVRACYRDARHTSVASPCASSPFCDSLVTKTRLDLPVNGAAVAHSFALSRPPTSVFRRAEQQCFPLPLAMSTPTESSPLSNIRNTRHSLHESSLPQSSGDGWPLPEQGRDALSDSPIPTRSFSHSPAKCVSLLEGVTGLPDVDRKDTQRLKVAALRTRDIDVPHRRERDREQEALGRPGGPLREREGSLRDVAELQTEMPTAEAASVASIPRVEVPRAEEEEVAEKGWCATGATQGLPSKNANEGQQGAGEQRRQRWQRYLVCSSSTISSEASSLGRRNFAPAESSQGQSDGFMCASVVVSPVMSSSSSSLLVHRGAHKKSVGRLCEGHTHAWSLRGATPLERQAEGGECSNARVCHPDDVPTRGAATGLHARKRAASREMPGDAGVISCLDSIEHAGLSDHVEADDGAVHRGSGDTSPTANEVRVAVAFSDTRGRVPQVSHLGYSDSGNCHHISIRKSHQPREYLGDSQLSGPRNAMSVPVTHHISLASQDRVSSKIVVIEDDQVVQPGPQCSVEQDGPFAALSLMDAAKIRSPSVPVASVVCVSTIEKGCAPDSKASLASPLARLTVPPEDSIAARPGPQQQFEDTSTRHISPVPCTSSNSVMLSPSLQRPHRTSAPSSSAVSRTESSSMGALLSLECTPRSISVPDTVTRDVSVTECEAPVLSTFFAVGHPVVAVPPGEPMERAAEQVSKIRFCTTPATAVASLRDDDGDGEGEGEGERKDRARLPVMEGNRGCASPTSWKRSPLPDLQLTERPSRNTQPERECTPDSIRAKGVSTSSLSSSTLCSVQVTDDNTPRLVNRLHTNAVLRKGGLTRTRSDVCTTASQDVANVLTSVNTESGSCEVAQSVVQDHDQSHGAHVSALVGNYADPSSSVLGVGDCDVSSVESAAAKPREAPTSASAQSTTKATVTDAASANSVRHTSAPRQHTHLSLPAGFSKSPIGSQASRCPPAHVLNQSSSPPLRGGECAVVREKGGVYSPSQRSMAAVVGDALLVESESFEEEDEDADGGYCGYGYESDGVTV